MPKNIYKSKSLPEETKRKISKAHMGKHHSKETRRKMSEAHKGISMEKQSHWKGGFAKNNNGYIHFKVPKGCRFSSMKHKDGYILLHRLMMAGYLQRPLRSEEVVHHINGNIIDNRIENFKLFRNTGEHTSLHRNSKSIKRKLGEKEMVKEENIFD